MKFALPVVKTVLFLVLWTSLAFAASPQAPGTGEGAGASAYTFAVIPYYGPEKIWPLFSPFVDYLKKTTGQPWRLKLYPNHEEFMAAIGKGEISMALLGPAPLKMAYQKWGAKPILVALTRNGKPVNHSVIVTNERSFKTLADLKGKKIGFLKGSSTSYLVPVKMLKNAGLALSDITPVFLPSQDRIMSALLSGEIDAGALMESMYQKFQKDNLKVLGISMPMPNFALCALPSFPVKARERLITNLLKLKPHVVSRDAEIVKEWDEEIKHGFMVPADDFLPAILNSPMMSKD